MSDSLLAQLDCTAAHVAHLPPKVRNSLLSFLSRWDAHQDVLDCLAHLDVDSYVSFQDRKAQALLGLDRADEAVQVMAARVAQRESVPARLWLARAHLANGDRDAALTAIEPLLSDDHGPAWSLRGEVHLQQGEWDAAESAFLRHRQNAPGSRTPLVGLAQLYLRKGDGVTAAAYAVQAYAVGEGERALSVYELHWLRDLFAALDDVNRMGEIDAELARLRQEELAEMAATLDAGGSVAPSGRSRSAPSAPTHVTPKAPPLPDLDEIPVSEAETQELENAARRLFGFEALRPGQAQIIACARRGENVLAILPTGAGKSLCYQLPALLEEGTTLVISPLIALMKDQVDKLPDAVRSQAIALNSSMDGAELSRAVDDVAAGRYRLVYAAPERLRQPHFLHALRRARLNRLVIDEAHCVSAWGHDFRPDYLYIAQAHEELGAPPILALTATAPLQVRRDIEQRLFGGTGEMRLVALDSFRPNLRLAAIEAQDKDEKLRRLVELCSSLAGSGIVYARTRRQCERLAALLRDHGVDATHYHAGIPDRALVQDRFMRGDVQVIVATIAFGMGVDKPDIRFIIHFGLPDSLEAYYQEAGRAGRDGESAYCILLHSSSDRGVLTRNANRDALTIDFLRSLYAAVQRRRLDGSIVAVSLDELARDLDSDEVKVRVGLSFLEQTEMLRRHHDLGRSLQLELLPPPADGSERVKALLDRYAAIQNQRIEEIVTYARSRRCLHGHLANYLGGQPRQRCAVCDRCLGDELLPALDGAALPDEREQLKIVLAVLAEQSWGRRTLARLLRGDRSARERVQRSRHFGSLNFRSATALRHMIETLIRAHCVEEVTLDHGGVMLAITEQGHAALRDPSLLGRLIDRRGATSSAVPATAPIDAAVDSAEAQACYERLVAWRTQQASEQSVPAYVIGSNETLRRIALAMPQSLDELAAVKGIGPAKLERYGEAILALVAGDAIERR